MRRSPLVVVAFGLLAACSCSEDPGPAPLVTTGPPLRLLARGPDAVIEQPGLLEPAGDLPGTITWGRYEGTGWSSLEHRTRDGTPYLETNQSVAKLILPVVEAADRDIELALWVPAPLDEGTEGPHRAELRLNGQLLGTCELGETLEQVRIHAPAPAWVRGDNLLEIATPEIQTTDGPRWETLALAGLRYAPTLRVELDLEHARATLPARTGLRTTVWQHGSAQLRIAGSAPGPGTLRVLTNYMNPRDGKHGEAHTEARIEVRAGRVEGRVALPWQQGTVRVIELEWTSPAGHDLTLEQLDVHESAGRAWPPIVFVSIDTFAARHLSLYGYRRKTTPVLDALQEEAVVFEHCNANAPWTMPSYLSVMTGLYPGAHRNVLEVQPGVELNNWDWSQIAPNRWTLAEALRSRGYRTAGFIDTYWLSPQFGVAQGFDHYDGEAALRPFEDPTAGIQLIVGERLPPWLARGPEGVPPFVFLHALDAHGPYIPEAPFAGSFENDLPAERHMVAADALNQAYGAIPTWMGRTLELDESIPLARELPLEDIEARYDETLLKVDSYLGRLFDLLRERGLYDQAVIVITGDHGERFGPDVYGHGVMHGDVLHVPLVLKLPQGEFGGTRVDAPVQLVDLYPTLLELAGAPRDPGTTAGAENGSVHGTSLLRRLREKGGPDLRYSEAGWVELYTLTEGRWKIVEERPGSESSLQSLLTHPRVPRVWLAQHAPELLEGPLTEKLLDSYQRRQDFGKNITALRTEIAGPYFTLFDLGSDPREERDLAAAQPEVLERMKARLDVQKQRSIGSRALADPDSARAQLSPDQLEELKKLGYGE